MANSLNSLENLEESTKLYDVEEFETFDIEGFLKDKRLAVEKVLVDSHVKLEVRIFKDNTFYSESSDSNVNKDKIITVILDDSIVNKVNIVNIIGNEVELKNVKYDDILIYGINCLQITTKDIDIKEHKFEGFRQRESFTKVDHRLMKMNHFKVFNAHKFLSSYEMKLLTVYPQNPTTARALVLITDDLSDSNNQSNVGKTFSIKINLSSVRDIPLDFLIGNTPISIDNVKGNLTGMTVKNNQVLLTADMLHISKDEKNIYVGINVNKDVNNNVNKDVNNNVNKDVNNNVNKDVNNNVNKDVNNNVNKDVNNNVNKDVNNKSNLLFKNNRFNH
ncbi:hypothetical protein [Staphylococcus caprae]|uniref:hypothetical protein n=1 Tax=Staphylococcus caprae TaxID=29380 RepID=UPI003B212753